MEMEQFYVKNQFVIRNTNTTYLQSYQSMIAKIDKEGNLILGKDWDYSNTTRKYLYKFLEDYIYNFNIDMRPNINKILNSANKSNTIQKMIDNKIIKYDKNL